MYNGMSKIINSSFIFILLQTVAAISNAAALTPSTSVFDNNFKAHISTVWKFSVGTWAENLAVRSDGSILVTVATSPQIYLVDATKRNAAIPLHTFHNNMTTGLTGIVENPPGSDLFYVVTGNATLSTLTFVKGSWAIHRLDLSEYSSNNTIVHVDKVADIPEAIFLNGLAAISKNVIIVAASADGVIWAVNTRTGAVTKTSDNALLGPPPNASLALGVNGLKVRGNNLFFTNSARGIIGHAKLQPNGGIRGDINIIASNLTSLDDFCFSNEGLILPRDPLTLVKLPSGKEIDLLTSPLLDGATAIQPAKHASENGEEVFYVTTTGGEAQYFAGNVTKPGRVLRVRLVNTRA